MASLDDRVTELLEQFAQRAEVELEFFVERCIADYQQDCHTKFGPDHVVTEDAMFEFFVDWLCRVVIATISDRFGAELVTQAELAAVGAMKSDLAVQLAPGGLLFPAGDSDEYCAVMFPQHYLQQIALRLAQLGDPEDGGNLLTVELLDPIGAPPLEIHAYWDVLRDILSGLADRMPVKYMATSRRVGQSAPAACRERVCRVRPPC